MELLENKIIREKLDSLTDLPLNYEVDLNSKFDLVMQAEKPHRKQSFAWLAFLVSAAAVYFLLSTYVFNQHESIILARKFHANHSIHFNIQNNNNQLLAIAYPLKKKPIKKSIHAISKSVKMSIPTIPTHVNIDPIAHLIADSISNKTIAIFNTTEKKHKSRFKEIDFDEQQLQTVERSESKREIGFVKLIFTDIRDVNTFSSQHKLSYKQSF